ncbi:hypothetical protein JZ751_026076, partial [Albula glossodonta]
MLGVSALPAGQVWSGVKGRWWREKPVVIVTKQVRSLGEEGKFWKNEEEMEAKEEAARLILPIVDELWDRSIVTGKPIRTSVFECLLECHLQLTHGWRKEMIDRVEALSQLSGIRVEDLLQCVLSNEELPEFALCDYVNSAMTTVEKSALEVSDLAMEEIEEEEKGKATAVAMEEATEKPEQAERTSFWKKRFGRKKNKSSTVDQAVGTAEEGNVEAKEKKVHAPK